MWPYMGLLFCCCCSILLGFFLIIYVQYTRNITLDTIHCLTEIFLLKHMYMFDNGFKLWILVDFNPVFLKIFLSTILPLYYHGFFQCTELTLLSLLYNAYKVTSITCLRKNNGRDKLVF